MEEIKEEIIKIETISSNNSLIEERSQRQSGLELLRIIAMLFIVMHHCAMFCNVQMPNETLGYIARVFQTGGKVGVNIFVLISAYFMINKNFKFTRILNILAQTFFYSVIIYFIFIISGKEHITLQNFTLNFLPVSYNRWWFVTSYVALLLISPILNSYIKSISKNTHKWICIISVTITVLFTYFSRVFMGYWQDIPVFLEIIWFAELYFVASYFKLYKIKIKKIYLFIILIVGWLFQILFTYFFGNREITNLNAFGVTLVSLSLFLLFKDLNFKSKVVNTISSTTFGVYLIHDNLYMRYWWWSFSVPMLNNLVNNYILTFMILTLATFIMCSIIDFIRLKTIHKLTIKLTQKIDEKIENIKEKRVNKTINT